MTVDVSYMIHTCVTCADLDRSLEFYTKVLGAKIAGPITPGEGETFGLSMGSPGARRWRGCFLYWGDPDRTSYIDLIEYLPGEEGVFVPRNGNDLGFARIALRVPDIETAQEQLASHGVPLVGPPTEFTAGGITRKIVFIRDPDGTLIELVERERPHVGETA